ncbi:protein trichome birefringence-like 26 [Phalaenopsis equestris]|uniref:protein trichome birefringence-like 26 n=1 Tax=Phalaenopsis equestris TaxID=78828 RepID=UPI0009E53394|nr:protein trichome birefringence-like 26 [Phalaenopsis equestris]
MSAEEEHRLIEEDRKEAIQCPASARKKTRLLLILFAAVLVIGLSFLLLYPNSSGSGVRSCPASSTRFTANHRWNHGGQCDLFSGEWICDPYGPIYTNNSCNLIEAPQNCMRNGRPDTDFLYWRWKPFGCELPPFDPFKFIKAMKNKSWAFIGDSIFRNHIQSLLCLLSKIEEPVEVYHDKAYKSRTWYFVNHNLTIAVIWSPFMIKSETFEDDDGKSKAPIQLHLDILEQKWTGQYDKYDYVIFSGGQWFLKTMIMWENSSVVGCHNCGDDNLKELGFDYPYRKALQMCYDFVASSEHKPLVFFRTWTPDHFEHGEWFSGGVCNRRSPYEEGDYSGKPVDHEMRAIEVEEFEKARGERRKKKGTRGLRLLDTFYLSLLRPDGHPGPYRTFHPFAKGKKAPVQNDCLHWCLPGPIDTWNELIMKILVDEGDILV